MSGAFPFRALSPIHRARTYGGKRRNFVGQHFWARAYWLSTVGHNEAAVRLYIQEQAKEDQRLDQLGLRGGEPLLGAAPRLTRLGRFTIYRPPALPEVDDCKFTEFHVQRSWLAHQKRYQPEPSYCTVVLT